MLQLRPLQTPSPRLNQKSSAPVVAFETLYVTQVDERSDTHVRGYGYNGTVSVNSSIRVTQKVWVRRENGSEDCLQLTDRQMIKVRPGHLLRRAYLQKPGSKNFHLIATYCPETGDYRKARVNCLGVQYPVQERLATLFLILSLIPAFCSPVIPILLLGPLLSMRVPPGVNPPSGLINFFFMLLFFAVLILPPIPVIYFGSRPIARLSKWSAAFSRYVEAELRR